MTDPIYRGEAWLKSWRDSSSGGRTITLQIDEDGTHPFKGYEGERFAIVIVPIGNDEKPMEKAQSPQAKGGVARAEKLSPERRTEIASTAAKRRWNELRPSARAAMLTKDPQFWEYLAEYTSGGWAEFPRAGSDGVTNQPAMMEECADRFLKADLGVKSKADLDTSNFLANKLQGIEGNFRAWQQAKGHQAA